MSDGGIPCTGLVFNLVCLYLYSSYYTNGVVGPGFGLSLSVGAGVGILVGIFNLGYMQYLGWFLDARFVVASILLLYALFLMVLYRSVFLWNITASCLIDCIFVSPMSANVASGVGSVRASTRSRYALVTVSLGGSQASLYDLG